MPGALDRARMGDRIEQIFERIADIQQIIATTPASTLDDAAVQLRRLSAWLEDGQNKKARVMLRSALAVVEGAADLPGDMMPGLSDD